ASQAGFSVTDKDGVPFWSEFRRLGGITVVGYPMSRRFLWDGFVTQVFQKAVFQWRPEAQSVYFINVFDKLHDTGYDDWLESSRSTPKPLDGATFDAGKNWQQVVAGRQALLNANAAIKAVYYSVPDPMMLFGLPTSPVVDNGDHYAIRLQRAVIQQWKVDVPWAKAGQATIANGGDIAVQAGTFAPEIVTPMSGPNDDAPVNTPGTPTTNPTPQPVVNPPYAGDFGYGMQAHLMYSGRDQALDMVTGAGFGWVKQQLRWEWIEPYSKGQYAWDQLDGIVDAASARGLRILFSVTAAPLWATNNNPVAGPPVNYQDMADFMQAVAARYKGRVQAYEIWNEQNLWYEWGGQGRINAQAYVDLLKTVYPAIKNVDPSAIVISGALTPTGVNDGVIAVDDVVYMEQMYQAGLKNYCDAVGAHPGGYNNPPGDWTDVKTVTSTSFKGHPSFYFRRVEQLHDVMVRNGDGNKKMWFTEFGWSTANQAPGYEYGVDNSEQQQAAYVVQAYQMAKNWGWVGAAFLWNLNFATVVPPTDEKAPFGIINGDWSPRPAYFALRNMAK
ncbi:MAG: cellulase family glycosylhydrolase, partial [Chloroflexota bacterium]